MFLESLIRPFDYEFMQRAFYSCILLAFSGVPAGVFLMLRRNSLVGEAMSHGIMPGIAVAYIFFGTSLWMMCIGGILSGILVAWLSNFISKKTILYEDASFTVLYILFLAIGIFIISINKSNIDIMHFLFGSILAIDQDIFQYIVWITSVSLGIFVLIYPGLLLSTFDKIFARCKEINLSWYNFAFLALVVCNLVAAYQAMGTMMALGIMMVPAVTARLISNSIPVMIFYGIIIAITGSFWGILWSFYYNLPTGPLIIMTLGFVHIVAVSYTTIRNRSI